MQMQTARKQPFPWFRCGFMWQQLCNTVSSAVFQLQQCEWNVNLKESQFAESTTINPCGVGFHLLQKLRNINSNIFQEKKKNTKQHNTTTICSTENIWLMLWRWNNPFNLYSDYTVFTIHAVLCALYCTDLMDRKTERESWVLHKGFFYLLKPTDVEDCDGAMEFCATRNATLAALIQDNRVQYSRMVSVHHIIYEWFVH